VCLVDGGGCLIGWYGGQVHGHSVGRDGGGVGDMLLWYSKHLLDRLMVLSKDWYWSLDRTIVHRLTHFLRSVFFFSSKDLSDSFICLLIIADELNTGTSL